MGDAAMINFWAELFRPNAQGVMLTAFLLGNLRVILLL
jgi:hypothetical protein